MHAEHYTYYRGGPRHVEDFRSMAMTNCRFYIVQERVVRRARGQKEAMFKAEAECAEEPGQHTNWLSQCNERCAFFKPRA
ncbi:MAG: hypothetical protein ACYDCK_01060 [Thermoplasmatota archaeon]